MTAATETMRHRTRPRQPAVDHATAKRLAAAEYGRFIGQLRDLAPGEWAWPTACPAWDVHATACHVLGMAEFAASPIEQARQSRAARRAKGPFLDALTARQVAKHLTGPAGGHWAWGTSGPCYELDAVEFCRIVSGRGSGDGLLATPVPF
jgi:hypothetical protein